MSDLEISAACGINRRTLARWKERPGFRVRVGELRTTWDWCWVGSIASQSERLSILEWRVRKLNQIVKERAISPEMQSVPGGCSGLFRVRRTLVGRGAHAFFITNSWFDVALTREVLRHLAQAANELGQWRQR